MEVLSFKTIFLPIVIIIFSGGCTKVFDKDRVLNVQFYDTQRAINGDVFIWATYLNRIKSDKRYGDGDYFDIDDDYDTRSYRFNNSGIARIYETNDSGYLIYRSSIT